MKQKTVNLIFCALFTAIISVFAQIQIPTPLYPITLQTFAIALCGYTLGYKNSLFSVLAYILLGILGAPIFSGFCGGFHHISEPAGGFVIGFLPLCVICGLSAESKSTLKKILLGVLGVLVMYVFGIIHFCRLTLIDALSPIVLMFVLTFVKDIAVTILAVYISKIIKDRIKTT